MASYGGAIGGFASGLARGLMVGERLKLLQADDAPAGKAINRETGAAPSSAETATGDSSADSGRRLPTFASLQGGAPSNAIGGIINDTALKYGIDPNTFSMIGKIESRFDPNAENKSGASGLFQMMPKTWGQYGKGGNVFDPAANADAAARLYKDNEASLRKSLGRDPTPGEMYLAHQQGAGGASKLLANPGARAADLVGMKAVTANGGGSDMTAGQFAGLWTSKFNGIDGSSRQVATPSAPGNGGGKTSDQPTPKPSFDPMTSAAPGLSDADFMQPGMLAPDGTIAGPNSEQAAPAPKPVSSGALTKMRAALFGPAGRSGN